LLFNHCLEIMNKTFQEIYNEGEQSVIKWMDKVMLTENHQYINIFNG